MRHGTIHFSVLIKKIAVAIMAILLTLIAVDMAVYWGGDDLSFSFADYYKNERLGLGLGPAISLNRGYPPHYFRADPVTGFDISHNAKGAIGICDTSFPIFSNDIGCFDRHALAEIQSSEAYDFFTGDSFTWGYAHYDSNFPTIFEKQASRFSVKCGITHSGQRHQFDKFKRTVKLIGRYPERVFVGFYENDAANDFAYPHSTVINGNLLDTVQLDLNYRLVQRSMASLKEAIARGADQVTPGLLERAEAWLFVHSLSVNFMSYIYVKTRRFLAGEAPQNLARFAHLRQGWSDLYGFTDKVSFAEPYLTMAATNKHRAAIEQWAMDARAHSYELIFLLIPPLNGFDDVNHYSGLRKYLDSLGVRFLDLSQVFKKARKRANELYWTCDGHFSDEGNVFVGKVLAKAFAH